MPSIPRVLLFPNEKLRRRASPLPDSAFGTSGLRDYCQLLANLLKATERAHVLASTQIDFDPPWRVLALSVDNASGGGCSILCNPVIKDEGGEAVEFEMSASFACVPVMLSAPDRLTVQYRKPMGERREVVCQRSGARSVFQGGESLNGKPLVDRMTAAGAMAFIRRYREEIDERVAPEIFLPGETVTLLH
jgi:peptide deformylase